MTSIPEVASMIQAHMINSWPKKFMERIEGRRVLVIPRYVKPTVDNGVPASEVFNHDEFLGVFSSDPAGSQFRDIRKLVDNADRVMLIGMNRELLTKYSDAGKMLIAAAVFNLYASFTGCIAVSSKKACSMIEDDIYNGKYALIRYFVDMDSKVPYIFRNGRVDNSLRSYWHDQLVDYWSHSSDGSRATLGRYDDDPKMRHVSVLCDIKFGRPYGQLVYHYLRCNLSKSDISKHVQKALDEFFTGNDVQFLGSINNFSSRLRQFVSHIEEVSKEDEMKSLTDSIREELSRKFEKEYRKSGSGKIGFGNKGRLMIGENKSNRDKKDIFKLGNDKNQKPGKRAH